MLFSVSRILDALFCSNQSININIQRCIRAVRLTQKSVRSFRPADILQNGTTLTKRRQTVELSRYFCFLCIQIVFS